MQGWSALSVAKAPIQENKKSKKKKEKKKPKKEIIMSNGIKRDHSSNEALLKCPDTPESVGTIVPEMELVDVNVEEDPEKTAEDLITKMDEGVVDMLEYNDDGYIELIFKLLARICDGQHFGLQNYLREQPDNVKSFNIVGETAQFLNVVYSTINNKTINLIIQLFNTLNEFCSGNQENRVVVYDRKIVDYINFILRAGEIADCPPEKVLDLRQAIAAVVISLIEENGPGKSQVAKEVKDTIDKEAIYNCMTICYEAHTEKPNNDDSTTKSEENNVLKSARSLAALGGSFIQGVVKQKNQLKDTLMEVGFTFYLILARMLDLDPHLNEKLNVTADHMRAFEFYKKNSLSIEILKDDVLQKVHFRVKNKNYLREEVKEKLKWSVDRSSPSNKIRDLMSWSRDIMKDICYQRKILHNPIAMLFTKGWLVWNYGAIFLSLVINLIMLITWNSNTTRTDFLRARAGSVNGTTVPWSSLRNPNPRISEIAVDQYTITMYVLMGTHNLLSLFVVISYFLSNHPRFPSKEEIKAPLRSLVGNKSRNEVTSEKKDDVSKLDVKFFSFTTFYYLLFLGMSVAGTLYQGYFFAFHLLNIVNNNQLLSGVIKAVTLNGVSLLWVAILGLIVIYIYSLVGFALLQEFFIPGDYLYCASLWQCTVTVIRYGLIGDMWDYVKQHDDNASFASFWPLVLYHVSFFIFITTIGLNIIFGIIVDTFSELRDLKWRAESDMKDTCFICSRNSYDFEHHGKGFDHHVRNEHNMWSYIFFLIHLEDVKTSDYTALELYVCKLVGTECYDFFPNNRALCLTSVDTDSTESKIDELLNRVTSIALKQKEEETEKKRKAEKMKQKRWQEKHRQFMFGIPPDDEENNDDGKDNLAETLLITRPKSERSLSRPPSIVSLQKTATGTDSGDAQSPPRPRKLATSSQVLHTPPVTRKELGKGPTKDKEHLKDAIKESEESDVPESDSESVGSAEGSYELLKDDSPTTQELIAPPFRERALSMPYFPPMGEGVFSSLADDDIEEEQDGAEEFQDAEQGPDVVVVLGHDQGETQHTRL